MTKHLPEPCHCDIVPKWCGHWVTQEDMLCDDCRNMCAERLRQIEQVVANTKWTASDGRTVTVGGITYTPDYEQNVIHVASH